MPETNKLFSSLEEYWWFLQKHRRQNAELLSLEPVSVPYRKSFNPMKIPSILPFISLMEKTLDGKMVLRLRGTELEQILPKVNPDHDMKTLIQDEKWSGFIKLHDCVTTHPCSLHLHNRIKLASGVEFMAERISFPMADKTGQVRFIINVGIPERNYTSTPLQNAKVASIQIRKAYYEDIGYGIPDVEVDLPADDIVVL